ncbi:MAG: ammonia-forming cytochrome c nitrite reductase subunit c552 [Chloroflexi bacterium HGW-Chloroflexi-3]|nr:MAG: ammonia-forming cytochrome c nitrite reductase subunit c552 [Chloroflexi bacterium HGW-Chloroflexi-3]
MKKISPIMILSVTIAILVIAVLGLLWFIQSQPDPIRGIPPLTDVSPNEPDSSVWGVNFPNQYSTFLMTAENNTRTAFGGSEPVQKLEVDPRLVVLFSNMAFSKDYKEDRGHMHSVTDVEETERVNETTPGTCYSCKSANNVELWKEMGAAQYASTPFSTLGKKITEPIGCVNCHDSASMRLVVTNPALEKALEAQGKDWRTFTRQEMRSLVCANCHVEYYFAGEGKLLVFPWAKGMRIENISEFYQEIDFSDWTHGESGAPMIKMQHPDYELFTADSTHYKAGVACADCHMPYTKDGAAKFSSHNMRSPLLNPEASCGTCHTSVNYVTERVSIIQNQVWDTMVITEDAIIEAAYAIKAAADVTGVDPVLLAEARQLHREAQLRWDFIAAENSMGFHNPSEALRILASATDIARQAQLKAIEATGQGLNIQVSTP